MIQVCTGKIHRASVTGCDLEYEGSVSIDRKLMSHARLVPGQLVHINNVANGVHWETYCIPAPSGSGDVILNGPPAHHFDRGDLVVILGWELLPRAALMDRKLPARRQYVVHVANDDRAGWNHFVRCEVKRLGW